MSQPPPRGKAHHAPNLYSNRHGNYYLRVTLSRREVKRSLRTKEPSQAKLATIAFAWVRLMDMKKPLFHELPMGRELGVLLPAGAKITDIKTRRTPGWPSG